MGPIIRKTRSTTTAAPNRKSKSRAQTIPPRNRRSPPQICRADASQVGFGDLPAELRNQIYTIALTPSFGAAVRIVPQPDGNIGQDIAFGLLISCKAVHREAWSFLYEQNTFRVDCVGSATRSIEPDNPWARGWWQGHRVFDGYQHKPSYSPAVKDYEVDLSNFITATNHKHGLQSIRSISFSYYANAALLPKDDSGRVKSFPERADLIIVLRLLPKSPFFSTTIDHKLSNEQSSQRKARVIEDVRRFMSIEIDPLNGAKKMCKDIMVEFMDQSHRWCRSHHIGS